MPIMGSFRANSYLRYGADASCSATTARWALPRVVAAFLLWKVLLATVTGGSAAATHEYQVRRLILRAKEKIGADVPLSQITKLDLSDLGLSELPHGFARLLPNLSILFLSNNRFRQLPKVIGDLAKLRMVAFKHSGVESIHPDAFQQPQLEWLILTGNKIRELPETIGRCSNLKKLMLSGNRLTKLPDSIQKCHKLELIRLASNKLSSVPRNVLKLPNLRWLALSDNPFLPVITTPDIPVLSALDTSQGEVLGSGASGITSRVTYKGSDVAVKQYRGALTSDGLPQEERRIAILASTKLEASHGIVKVLGQTKEGALVMEFLQLHAVGKPPTLETCTRDVYDTAYPIPYAVNLVSVVLDALANLHEIGIMHGDLYGHNILMEGRQVRLSDFGAAFFYDTEADYGRLLQRVELRAFATFVEEVAALSGDDKQLLLQLRDKCLNATNFDAVLAWWKVVSANVDS